MLFRSGPSDGLIPDAKHLMIEQSPPQCRDQIVSWRLMEIAAFGGHGHVVTQFGEHQCFIRATLPYPFQAFFPVKGFISRPTLSLPYASGCHGFRIPASEPGSPLSGRASPRKICNTLTRRTS